jgi:hypothetical protein
MPGFGLALAMALSQVLPAEPVERAPAEAPPQRSSRQVLALSFGAAIWPGLRDLGQLQVPPGWAPFEEVGFTMEASYLHHAFHLHGADVLLGASVGLNVTRAGSPDGVPLNPAGQPGPGWWLIATGVFGSVDARLQASAGPFRPFASAGVGAMNLTMAVEEAGKMFSSLSAQDVFYRSRPMAWLGAGADYRFGPPEFCWGLVAEFRVQFVDMGAAPSFASSAGTLRGPIYSITLGPLLGWGATPPAAPRRRRRPGRGAAGGDQASTWKARRRLLVTAR